MTDDRTYHYEAHLAFLEVFKREQDAERREDLRARVDEALQRHHEAKIRQPDIYVLERHNGHIVAGPKGCPRPPFKAGRNQRGVDIGREILSLGARGCVTKEARDFVGSGSRPADNLRNTLARAGKVFEDNGCHAIAHAYRSISVSNDGRITIKHNPREIIELGPW